MFVEKRVGGCAWSLFPFHSMQVVAKWLARIVMQISVRSLRPYVCSGVRLREVLPG